MRITDSTPDILIHIRVSERLKKEVDEIADKYGISTAAFARQALEEKVQREHSGIHDETLEDTIRRVVSEMVSEKKGAGR